MAQCSGKHISAMQLFYELKQRFPHIPDRLVNHCIKQAQGDREACWCMLKSEKPRMSEMQAGKIEVPCASVSPTIERPRPVRPPASHPTTYMPPNCNQNRSDQALNSLIQRQLKRKENLEKELQNEKRKLSEMKKREEELKNELSARLAACDLSVKARMLSDEIRDLTADCSKLSEQVDEEPWWCHICTFQNHHLISQCESCSMPQGGETQNIHIHVTHHNFPSCNCFYQDYDECEYDTQ